MGTDQMRASASSAKNEAKNIAEAAKDNPWVERWMRLGYATRGLLYGMVGFLAIQLLVSGRGQITDRTGALATLMNEPYGDILLSIVALGALGYAIWNIFRAIYDPFNEGHDLKGSLTRIGSAVTGISYAFLTIPIVRLIRGSSSQSDTQNAQEVATGLFTYSWGPWVVGLVGLIILGAGLSKIYRGWADKYDQHFKYYEMSAEQREWAERMGKIGYIAQGTVLAIIGGLAVLAAVTLDPQRVGGIDQALGFLIQQPYGPFLLGVVAAGLIAYAIYSFMGEWWFKIKEL